MPESRPGTQPLACAREELRQAEQRLAELAQACARPCERLLTALGQLPEAARFEPFPAEPATPAVGAASGREQPGRRHPRGQGRAAAPSRPGDTPGDAETPQTRAPTPAASTTHAVPAPADGNGLRPRSTTAARADSRPGGRSHDTKPSLGEAVAALLARWPETPEPPPARPVAPIPPAGGNLAETPLGQIIQDIVARSTGRPTERQSAPARQFARLPAQFQAATATAAALAEWLAGQAPAPAAGSDRLAPALAGQGTGLLARLLAGQDPPAQNPPAGEHAPLPRPTAPRARSRLTGDSPPEGAARPPKEAPGGDPLPGEEGGELAKQLNRLLLDQAWLRGVDLT